MRIIGDSEKFFANCAKLNARTLDKETILTALQELEDKISLRNFYASAAELKNIISAYAGKASPYYEAVDKVNINAVLATDYLNSIVKSFLRATEKDLVSEISYVRKIKVEVVNDYLNQAEELLDLKEYHPAPVVVLIGASLEEFLRNWVTDNNVELGNQKPSIDSYAKALRNSDFITKQDLKEITVWGGLRNAAAHGEWNVVDDRDKITMMLRGVSLFIKQYSR